MNIKKNGIYFRRYDEKETGYYTSSPDGGSIHHKYEKPSFLERMKYLAKYGHEESTIYTSYYLFNSFSMEIMMGSVNTDAVSLARTYRKLNPFPSRKHDYTINGNRITFYMKDEPYILDIFDDGDYVKQLGFLNKIETNKEPEVYQFLNWDNL